MKIIAIDPGYERLGLAVLEKKENIESLIFSDTFQTSVKKDFSERLFEVINFFEENILKYRVEVLAIEDLFFNTNQKTASKISEIRGALIYCALKNNLKIFQYTPLQIKTAVAGYGRADKKQVFQMVQHLLKIEKKIKYDDEYDAIACGLTFFACDFRNLKRGEN